ncbi:hypothetical protein HPP92_002220 [Vanilla planifolia]|uniref:PHD-type zinc finger plants domain-containing protein n=1 Tax=Vanilla planifolia TaxID=51239 RepID=A0A835VEA8_VANPL|nr:hypothetical protein HPP92_002220 [Vanilla planifolia]
MSKGCTEPPSPSSMVCCMCGDYGLPRELFRCKVCFFRSQHSDLYPKAEVYRACNWCLREEAGRKLLLSGESLAIADQGTGSSSTSSSPIGQRSNDAAGWKMICRGGFSTKLSKPVKKQRLSERRSQPQVDSGDVAVGDGGGGEELSPGSGRGRQVLRGKARRYKLLEEVSS